MFSPPPPEPSPPLLELFNRLRLAGLPLGTGEYQLVLKALQGGFGVQDRAALRRLCERLWTKNDEEKRLLHQYFEELLPLEQDFPPPRPVVSLARPRFSPSVHPWLVGGIACGISLVAVIGYIATRPLVEPVPFEMPGSSSEKPAIGTPNPSPTPVNPEPLPPASIPKEKPFPFWLRSIVIGGLALSAGLLIWCLSRWWLKRNPTKPTERLSDQIAGATTALHDEIEAARAQERFASEAAHHVWIATPGLPATERQMKRSWRYLSHPVREGTPTELDVEATIQQIGQRGLLLDPVLVPPRTNQAALLLLVDRDGSMEPFHALTERLVATAQRGGRFGMTQVYYFHN